ncbi:MAG TPA: hypothetical protein VEM15_05775, partial [Thermodesulfobacteriota bacterium]|nr:hypothetical protein [Thermodesulfobacteriota bacterium]
SGLILSGAFHLVLIRMRFGAVEVSNGKWSGRSTGRSHGVQKKEKMSIPSYPTDRFDTGL